MDYFDKKINELYNQPEQDVPNDLSWDFMEDGIYSRMDNKKSKRRAIWFWISGGIIAAALIVGSVIIFNAEKKNTNFATNTTPVNTKDNSSKSNKEVRIPTNISNTENTTIQTNVSPVKEEMTKNIIPTESHSENKYINLQENTNTLKNKLIAPQSSAVKNNIVRTNTDPSVSIYKNTSTKNISNESNRIKYSSTTKTDALESSEDQSRDAIELNEIASIVLSTLEKQRELVKPNTKSVENDSPRKVENKRNTKYAFSLLGGTSLNSGYNIQSNDYTSSRPGYSIRLGLSAEKESGWGYEFGIGHALLVEKFDLDITDTVPEHHTGIVVGHLTSTITGNTTNVIGNATRFNSRDRREVIYNTINLLSIDAAINRRINIYNKWSIIPSVGLQYDRVMNINGKSLATENTQGNREIYAYDNSTSEINKNLFSTRLGIGIDYALTQRFSLSARASTSLSFNNLYRDSNRLGITYLQGGITIRL